MSTETKEQMQADREFEKKEWANASFLEKFLTIAVPIFGLIAMLKVTWMIFFAKHTEPCGIDKVGLWCRTHPMTFWDVLGLILFYIGCGWLTTILSRLVIRLGLIEDDSSILPGLNWASWALTIIGFAIMYAA